MTCVRIYNPRDLSKYLELNLIVDTGATYTWIKRERLRELGIQPKGRRKFLTIEGRVIEREIGEAVVECLGEQATTVVVFAEEHDVEVLGLHALEGLGLEVDPVTGQLRKAEVLLAL